MKGVPNVKTVELGQISCIPSQTFKECQNLTTVTYNKNPNIELSVGLSAFMNCYKMNKPNFKPKGDI